MLIPIFPTKGRPPRKLLSQVQGARRRPLTHCFKLLQQGSTYDCDGVGVTPAEGLVVTDGVTLCVIEGVTVGELVGVGDGDGVIPGLGDCVGVGVGD